MVYDRRSKNRPKLWGLRGLWPRREHPPIPRAAVYLLVTAGAIWFYLALRLVLRLIF